MRTKKWSQWKNADMKLENIYTYMNTFPWFCRVLPQFGGNNYEISDDNSSFHQDTIKYKVKQISFLHHEMVLCFHIVWQLITNIIRMIFYTLVYFTSSLLWFPLYMLWHNAMAIIIKKIFKISSPGHLIFMMYSNLLYIPF